jgi:hypothetical protein
MRHVASIVMASLIATLVACGPSKGPAAPSTAENASIADPAASAGGRDPAAPADPNAPAASPPGVDPNASVGPPAAAAAGDCAREIALSCASGQKDGCLLRDGAGAPLTSYHICVAEAKASGMPCAQEIARVCAAGTVDACLLRPAASSQHICVVAPK